MRTEPNMENKLNMGNKLNTAKKLNIVADNHIWGIESAFSALPGFDVDLRLLENKHINPASLSHADILLTRSSTAVNAALLSATPVRFAATATIGDDHYDKAWLDTHGIGWANAAGSSTGSVLEYMLSVLFDLHARGMIDIPQTSIGIIGVGRIGSALATLCEKMGMTVLRNDPPRARLEGDEGFHSLNELLAQADILSLHTPLIHHAEDDCTVHLLAQSQMALFQGKGIINAARGSCLDNAALCNWLDEGAGQDGRDTRFAVLDCWENEPTPLNSLLKHSGIAIATPHIAGHSVEGKAANTQYIYNALCRFLNIQATWNMADHLPALPAPVSLSIEASVQTSSQKTDIWQTLHAASKLLYPIHNDDKAMRSWADLSKPELAKSFTGYRRNYPARRAWHHAAIQLNDANADRLQQTLQMAQAIGLKIV